MASKRDTKKKDDRKLNEKETSEDVPLSKRTRHSTAFKLNRLSKIDIEKTLNSDDEFEDTKSNIKNVGKDEKPFSLNNIKPDSRELVIVLKKEIIDDLQTYVVIPKTGEQEKMLTRFSTNALSKTETPRTPSRQCKKNLYLNEDYLAGKGIGNVKINSRKRTQSRGDLDDCEEESENNESEAENKMQNANLSPKRPKSTNIESIDTPVKRPGRPRKSTISKLQDSTPSKRVLQPRTPSKKNIVQTKDSIDTPTKAMGNLNLNETPSRNRRNISQTPTKYSNNVKKRLQESIDKDKDFQPSEFEESDDEDDSVEYDDEYDDSNESYESDFSPKSSKRSRKSIVKNSGQTPVKLFSKLALTPSVKRRTINIVKPTTPLQEARLKLHVSVLPKSLPCREEEFNTIYSFLHARLSDESGGCIYISGVPGTGKTATVNEVIRILKKSMIAGKLTEFEFVDINGMKLSEPRQAYVQIWKQLSGKTTSWEEAHKLLYERFTKSNSKRGMTLLLVDELDLLCTKRQDVVYNLLDWPTKTNAKLVVVTIANTMDLPERILMGKVTSRLGLTRVTFPPYNHHQLEQIVVSRLKGFNAFGGEAIQLVARKVAAVSGDARRALDICRRATEIAETNNRDIVNMMDVKRALDEMIASPKIQAIKHCSDMEKAFLEAVCAEVMRTGVEEVSFKNVYFQFETTCRFNGEIVPNMTEALAICNRLSSWRLLLCDHSKMDIHQRLLLNVSTEDVHFAIQTIKS